MKQVIRCHVLTIPKKLRCDVRLTFDDKSSPEFVSVRENATYTNVTMFPNLQISILRPREFDENGRLKAAPWNPDDNIGLTNANLPTFMDRLMTIQKGMRIPKLYVYHGKRLEINEAEAEKIRQVVELSQTMKIEFSAVVLSRVDLDGNEVRAEGIKMKFNNEKSSVLLTLDEVDSLIYNINHLDLNLLGFLMYLNYVKPVGNPNQQLEATTLMNRAPEIDIKPIKTRFASPEDELE